MKLLYTLTILLGLSIMQALAQKLPETFIVVIGQVEGYKDGETFTVMESDGNSGSPPFILMNGKFPEDSN